MVAIRVRRQVEDVLRHLGADCQNFLMQSRVFLPNHSDENLNCARPVQVHGDIRDLGQASADQLFQSLNWSNFDELLAEVVAKLIRHHFWQEIDHDMNESA